MTPELRGFLVAWLAWAEDGAPDNQPFSRRMGLCGNALKREYDVLRHLTMTLVDDFQNSPFPFNSEANYYYEAENRAMHRNPARLAWVRKQLEILS